MANEPSVIVFDVNETLSDMAPMRDRFAQIGCPPDHARLWFASLLRDGFALTAAGDMGRFAEIGAEALRILLTDVHLTMAADQAVDYIMKGFMMLDLHPDVPDGVRSLKAAGYRLVTLTNGATRVAEQLFAQAGIHEEFEALLSVEEAPAWKPAASSYKYAARVCGVDTSELLLVAVHPWDIHGASRAGLGTAWVNRAGAPYPSYFANPDHVIEDLGDLTHALAS
jgi:2-haloacid dehalogenase